MMRVFTIDFGMDGYPSQIMGGELIAPHPMETNEFAVVTADGCHRRFRHCFSTMAIAQAYFDKLSRLNGVAEKQKLYIRDGRRFRAV